ncbi:MAG: acyl-CoA/acyl-ACP dehydrogenase [Cohaesibacteraceae bacterium]|nr:acyl-CoA/acyl-ACP dehydrogenase [Cohaesibacteraceae bacterium]
MSDTDDLCGEIRKSVLALCSGFPSRYWQKTDSENSYPTEFVEALSEAGYLATLIPEQYGGAGLGLREACVVLETMSRSGAHAGACHAQMYTMGTLLRHGSEDLKQLYLPEIASGKLRLQSFAVTEPDAGTDTSRITTFASDCGDHYKISGQKTWISRVEHSDLMILLARTAPRDAGAKPVDGMTVFLVDIRQAIGNGLTVQAISTMINHHTTQLFFDELRVPKDHVIGKVGQGFRCILDGMNAERILIASECIGDGRFFVDRAVGYARDRKVFGRAIGMNQGVQFPIARSYAEIEAASLMVDKAAKLFDQGQSCGAEANIAKLLASEASWKAADMCLQTHGGAGFAKELDIERKFRETRLYQVAPISTNLILSYVAERVLDLPKSY